MEKHLRISPIFPRQVVYVACKYHDKMAKLPKEATGSYYYNNGYRIITVDTEARSTTDAKKVTCPECKKTWEYIEASIEHNNTSRS